MSKEYKIVQAEALKADQYISGFVEQDQAIRTEDKHKDTWTQMTPDQYYADLETILANPALLLQPDHGGHAFAFMQSSHERDSRSRLYGGLLFALLTKVYLGVPQFTEVTAAMAVLIEHLKYEGFKPSQVGEIKGKVTDCVNQLFQLADALSADEQLTEQQAVLAHVILQNLQAAKAEINKQWGAWALLRLTKVDALIAKYEPIVARIQTPVVDVVVAVDVPVPEQKQTAPAPSVVDEPVSTVWWLMQSAYTAVKSVAPAAGAVAVTTVFGDSWPAAAAAAAAAVAIDYMSQPAVPTTPTSPKPRKPRAKPVKKEQKAAKKVDTDKVNTKALVASLNVYKDKRDKELAMPMHNRVALFFDHGYDKWVKLRATRELIKALSGECSTLTSGNAENAFDCRVMCAALCQGRLYSEYLCKKLPATLVGEMNEQDTPEEKIAYLISAAVATPVAEQGVKATVRPV